MLPGHGKEGKEVPEILENLGIGKLGCVERAYCIVKNFHRPLLFLGRKFRSYFPFCLRYRTKFKAHSCKLTRPYNMFVVFYLPYLGFIFHITSIYFLVSYVL